VLDASGNQVMAGRPLEELKHRVVHALTDESKPIRVYRRTPRQVRMFSTRPRVQILDEPANQRTIIELTASDRPGLLLQVGRVFEKHDITLQNAKVATIGERAEDVFFVTNGNGDPLSADQAEALRTALEKALSEQAD
jgi:[protein-PII] uridylyltransferase